MIIINRLLKESRKMRDNISESFGKMKMMLLSNIIKPGKGGKPAGKIDRSKTKPSRCKAFHIRNFLNGNFLIKKFLIEKFLIEKSSHRNFSFPLKKDP